MSKSTSYLQYDYYVTQFKTSPSIICDAYVAWFQSRDVIL